MISYYTMVYYIMIIMVYHIVLHVSSVTIALGRAWPSLPFAGPFVSAASDLCRRLSSADVYVYVTCKVYVSLYIYIYT